jgi:hypothetical protein
MRHTTVLAALSLAVAQHVAGQQEQAQQVFSGPSSGLKPIGQFALKFEILPVHTDQ